MDLWLVYLSLLELTIVIDDKMGIILIITKDHLYPKVYSALEQVTARNGKPILIWYGSIVLF
jgi:glucosamine 6-phosphate synthetase-like amidotransferase/phosphosugar isomerase protein